MPRNFGSVILANLPTRVPVYLLNDAKSPIGMTDLKIKRIFWGIGNFYRCRLQILANLSGKHFGWNGIRSRVKKSRKVSGQKGKIFLGHQGPRRQDIPDPGPGMSQTKSLCNAPSSVVSGRKWLECPAIWVGTCRDQKNFMQENFGLISRAGKRKF